MSLPAIAEAIPPSIVLFFFSSRRRHTSWPRDWSSDVCSSDLAAIGEFHDDLLNGLIVIVRVNAVGSTELARQFKFLLVNVHRNNPARLRLRGTNDGRQANAANAKNGYGSAFLNFGGVRYSAHTSGHAAAEQADLFQRCFLIHLGQGYFGQHGVFRKG